MIFKEKVNLVWSLELEESLGMLHWIQERSLSGS